MKCETMTPSALLANVPSAPLMNSLRLLAFVSGLLLFGAVAEAGEASPTQRVAIPDGGTCQYGSPELPSSLQTIRGFRSATVTGRVDIVPNAPPIAVVIEHSSGFAELDEAVLVAMRRIRCSTPALKPRLISAFQSFVFNDNNGDAIPIAPESARLFAGYGLMFDRVNMAEEANAAYADAIRVNPQYAATYSYRADMRERKGQLAEALADLDEAIKLNPQYTWALRQRASLRLKMGDAVGAAADGKLAMELLPRGNEYWPVGRSLFNAGDFGRASQALRLAVLERPDYAYAAIWSYVASMRAGETDRAPSEFETNSKGLDSDAWPSPVVGYLQGKVPVNALLAAAQGPNDADRAGRVCEANFYMAQKELIERHPQAAQPLLEAARRDCPKTFVEYTAAAATLGQMPSIK